MPIFSFNDSRYEVDKIPNDCPYCHKTIRANWIEGHLVSNHNLEIIFVCPNQNCNRTYIATYLYNDDEEYEFRSTNIGNLKQKEFSEEIQKISPDFIKIYNEAFFAEQNELLEICGVGFRKALEFLIKDYSIQNFQDKEEEIKTKPLAKCINSFVSDERIKNVAKRAVWLGNDETHYVRKWNNKDLSDLKKLIDLTVHWIEMERLTSSFEEEMPD